MFRQGDSLLKVGVPMTALALMIATAVVRATAGSEFGRAGLGECYAVWWNCSI